MRRKLRAIPVQLLVHPGKELLALTALLVTRPTIAAKLLIAPDRADLRQAVKYFSTAFSTCVILNAIAFRALDIETVEEFPFWVLHAAFVFLVAFLGSAFTASFKSAPF